MPLSKLAGTRVFVYYNLHNKQILQLQRWCDMNKDMREITDTKSEKTVSESLNLEWKEMRKNNNYEILDRVDVSTEGWVSLPPI